MPLPKLRADPDPVRDDARAPRAATGDDGFIASPVHQLHDTLWDFAELPPAPDLPVFPGWVRVLVPVLASGTLWLGIVWALGHLR